MWRLPFWRRCTGRRLSKLAPLAKVCFNRTIRHNSPLEREIRSILAVVEAVAEAAAAAAAAITWPTTVQRQPLQSAPPAPPASVWPIHRSIFNSNNSYNRIQTINNSTSSIKCSKRCTTWTPTTRWWWTLRRPCSPEPAIITRAITRCLRIYDATAFSFKTNISLLTRVSSSSSSSSLLLLFSSCWYFLF